MLMYQASQTISAQTIPSRVFLGRHPALAKLGIDKPFHKKERRKRHAYTAAEDEAILYRTLCERGVWQDLPSTNAKSIAREPWRANPPRQKFLFGAATDGDATVLDWMLEKSDPASEIPPDALGSAPQDELTWCCEGPPIGGQFRPRPVPGAHGAQEAEKPPNGFPERVQQPKSEFRV